MFVDSDEAQFGYEQSSSLNERIALVGEKRWHVRNYEHGDLGIVTEYTLKTADGEPTQVSLNGFISEYRDVLCITRTIKNADEQRRLYVQHAVNHVLK
jgi:hypothetical protein